MNAINCFGSYKGYALNLAIEMLAGSLVRGKMGSKIFEGLDRGFVFIVINPEIFVDINDFKEETAELIKEVKSSRKEKGFDEILIPGEKGQKNYEKLVSEGFIDVDKKLIEEIKAL